MMMRSCVLSLAALLAMTGCSTVSRTVDRLNPFSGKSAELAPIVASAEARVRWKADIGKAGDYVFAPAVSGSSVYVAAADGSIAKLEDGVAAWRINAGQPLSAGVGSDGKIVVVGTAKGDVLAFSAEDGRSVWRGRVTSEVLAAPAVDADGVAVRSGDNRVFLLDLKDGSRKWFYQRSTPTLSLRSFGPAVFADRFVFVGFPAGKLIALDVKNGAPVWEGTVSLPKGATELDRVADVVSAPLVEARQVCAAAFQGRVSCFDLGQAGQLIWARDISSAVGLAADPRSLYITDEKNAVHALDRSSGGSLWKQDKLVNRAVSAPAVRRSLVVVGDREGVVHLLRREDGEFAARISTDGSAIRTPPQVLGTAFLVQTSGGGVFAIEAQ